MAIKKYGYGYARKKRLLKWEEDEENLFKKNHNPEENKKKNLHLQTGKNMAFSGRASQIVGGLPKIQRTLSHCLEDVVDGIHLLFWSMAENSAVQIR